jgi:hypothetical protein
LERILVNVSLGLPENFDLIMGLKDMSFYYEYIESGVIATKHGILLSLSIPLREVTIEFEVLKMFSFPTAIMNDTYVQFYVSDTYLAINMAQRTHIALSAEDMGRCFGPDDFKICPADCAILANDFKTYALSLYLQADIVHTNCDRRVYAVPPSPTLLRHGDVVVY